MITFSKKGLKLFSLICYLLFLSCSDNTVYYDDESNSSQIENYALDYCVVSGNDLNDDTTDMVPFSYNHEGTTIVFCCKPCLPKFKKSPKKYLAIIKEEIEFIKKESSEKNN